MKIIITGGNGFIGTKLCNSFVSLGHEVYAIVKDKEENIEKLDRRVNIVYCELEKIISLPFCFSFPKDIDIFFHLAWVGVSTKYKNDLNTQMSNVLHTHNAINVAKIMQCKRFVGIGSMSEYAYEKEIVNDKSCPSPSDYYACSKIAAKEVCILFSKKNDISYNWCHITSIYGPERDDFNVLTYTIKSLLKEIRPVYTRLEQEWDYIYIDDLISALICIALKGEKNKTYFIGSGNHRPLLSYVNEIKQIINPNAELGIGELSYKSQIVDNSIVDIRELTKIGFVPKYTFRSGIEETIKYYLKKG